MTTVTWTLSGFGDEIDREPAIRSHLLPSLILLDAHGRIAFQEYVEITSLHQLERLVAKHLGLTL